MDSKRQAVVLFLAFAFAYFLSALIRAVTATLSPVLTQEFALTASDLGFLAGAYFLGFSLTQLPLGRWLDQIGAKRVLLAFLSIAVLGAWLFSQAQGFLGLWLARLVTGVGVSACLMAPLTAYRHAYSPHAQLRANSWMLMVGAFGMVAATLPVQLLLPTYGWRSLFLGIAALLLLAMLCIAWVVKRADTESPEVPRGAPSQPMVAKVGYREVFSHPYFLRHMPLALFVYGGFIAMQTLWATPWVIKVAGYTPNQAAAGMFGLNLAMLVAFLLWGLLGPRLTRNGWSTERIIISGLPIGFVALVAVVTSPAWQPKVAEMGLTVPIWSLWAFYCVSCTVMSTAQPAVGMAFPAQVAGRALSGYNLLIFLGVFLVQWLVGLSIDAFLRLGWTDLQAYQGAISLYGVLGFLAYVFFRRFDHQKTML